MPNTGYDWNSFVVLQNAVTLTTGGTLTNTSTTVSLDKAAGCEVTVSAAYSNHARATGGLQVSLLRTRDGTNWQVAADLPVAVEMVFTQNATRDYVFSVDPGLIPEFRILLTWLNTTASSSVTVTTRYRLADVPVAS